MNTITFSRCYGICKRTRNVRLYENQKKIDHWQEKRDIHEKGIEQSNIEQILQ